MAIFSKLFKKYQFHTDYMLDIKPCIAYCEDKGEVHYNGSPIPSIYRDYPDRLIVCYDVQTTEDITMLYNPWIGGSGNSSSSSSSSSETGSDEPLEWGEEHCPFEASIACDAQGNYFPVDTIYNVVYAHQFNETGLVYVAYKVKTDFTDLLNYFETIPNIVSIYFGSDNGGDLSINLINYGCTKYYFNEGITEISSFSASNLTSVVIPSTVTNISNFQNSPHLTDVYILATTPPYLGYMYAFINTNSNLKIWVPNESVDTYKAAQNWSNYASQIYGRNFG